MTALTAAIRPDSWNFSLFLHVLGAMITVGAVALAVATLFLAWSNGSERSLKLAFRALLFVALPSFIVMRVGAELIADKEGLNEEGVDVTWVNIGYIVSDPGLLFLIASTILVNVGYRRVRDSKAKGPDTVVHVAGVLLSLTLVGFLVAVWAMTTKPV